MFRFSDIATDLELRRGLNPSAAAPARAARTARSKWWRIRNSKKELLAMTARAALMRQERARAGGVNVADGEPPPVAG
jgi:hypothetical protein